MAIGKGAKRAKGEGNRRANEGDAKRGRIYRSSFFMKGVRSSTKLLAGFCMREKAVAKCMFSRGEWSLY